MRVGWLGMSDMLGSLPGLPTSRTAVRSMTRDSTPVWDATKPSTALDYSGNGQPFDYDRQAALELELLRSPLDVLLGDLVALVCRFVALPSDEAAVAVALWIAHSWIPNAFETTPRLAVISPELGSGKTRLLEVLDLVVREPKFATSITPAVLYRVIADKQPTILLDECDAVFGKKAAENHEDLRAVLNAGYRKGASVYRMTGLGTRMEVTEFETFSPVALAGIGGLPDTIMSRAVLIEMRRRRPDERVQPFRQREARELSEPVREALSFWALDASDRLSRARPVMPEGVTDRAADVWEPLLALADEAGGLWPSEARQAARVLTGRVAGREPSLAVRLLADIRSIFGGNDKLTTTDLCSRLAELEEAPWGDMYGKVIDARGVARRLKPFDIYPRTIRIGETTPRGYLRADFLDAWDRYLPSESETTETSATNQSALEDSNQNASATEVQQSPSVADEVQHVADKNPAVARVLPVADNDGEEASRGS